MYNIRTRILFICGTFELTKSGVADYINCLMRELISKGLQCSCIALHDPYASSSQIDTELNCQLHEVPVKRLSASLRWNVKADLLNAEIQAFNPDWISLHYVPYAYHLKGLPFGLLRCLGALRCQVKWHIMAHELWVDPSGALRNRLLSTLQQQIARRLFTKLRPQVTHVTNQKYQSMLSRFSIESRILPLFSAIPFCPGVSPPPRSILQWTFVLFGAINRDWRPEPLLKQIEIARLQHGVELCRFIAVGNAGDYGALLWDSLITLNYPAFSFIRLGELPVELVSEQLQHADFGIAVIPSLLVGKSSSVAAMISHGLPVIISRLSQDCAQWHQSLQRTGHFILLDSSFSSALASSTKYSPVNTLEATASQFVRDLELFSEGYP